VWKKDWGALVNYVETNPQYGDRVLVSPYRGIGRGIVDMIKARYSHFKLHALYSAANFWEKMGLELISPEGLEYEWIAKQAAKK
jgi:hypothetical protein